MAFEFFIHPISAPEAFCRRMPNMKSLMGMTILTVAAFLIAPASQAALIKLHGESNRSGAGTTDRLSRDRHRCCRFRQRQTRSKHSRHLHGPILQYNGRTYTLLHSDARRRHRGRCHDNPDIPGLSSRRHERVVRHDVRHLIGGLMERGVHHSERRNHGGGRGGSCSRIGGWQSVFQPSHFSISSR